ncbi:MAG: general secretion pathway protein GspK [Bdellovibrionales bacterium]|nr:general secretion pathway protein GspK [Bdellovibrionales bacterium]
MKRPLFYNKATSNRGVALIFVLGAITFIASIVIELNYRAQISKNMMLSQQDGNKAYELARAAYRWSIFRLALDNSMDKAPVIAGTNYGGKKDDLSEMQWAFPLSYPFPVTAVPDENSGEAPAEISDIGGSFLSAITDESAKINLNDVFSGGIGTSISYSGAARVLINLLASPRFRYYLDNEDILNVFHAIDDWTDSDTQVNHLGGADENIEHLPDGVDYKIKNGPFYSLAEIRLLKAIDDDFYQELLPFVTVYPFDAKTPRVSSSSPSAKGKININTAPVEILAALFSAKVVSSNRARLECAQKIALARTTQAFRGISKKDTQPNLITFVENACNAPDQDQVEEAGAFIEKPVSDILSVRSDLFRIEAQGITEQMEKRIDAVVQREEKKPKILYWKVQ